MQFEGHEGKLTNEPGTQPFPTRHSPKRVSTNSQLPPGHPAYRKNERGGSRTKRSFLKKVGD